ncbi:DnaD domain protein [Limosilactobacillus viscerum]|uniref:DnaD domain protein n=1 Tax=Limosilactobacillus viscerum TaxID=2993450 RepID=UPI0024BBC87A|nr:DnaD domain protein [Limosilactobacillus viscerum]
MAAQQGEFDPQAGFIVTAASDFVNFSSRTFTSFYQPVLGPTAFSLFYALKEQLLDNPTLGDRRLQSNIIRQLNSGSSQIAHALHRLEAVGLVRTLVGNDDQGTLNVYQLHPTLTPVGFIEDDLLSVLLLEAVGDASFKRLSKWAHRYELASHPQLTDVSHHFLDEFHVASQSVISTPETIATARQQNTVEKTPRDLGTSNFDWPTLYQLLDGQPVVKKDLERHQRLVEVEHQLYGIDEPTMKGLILRAVNLADNHFDPTKFKQVVAASYQRATASPATAAVKSSDKQMVNAKLTAKDQQLLKSVGRYSPIDFLQSLKEQTGGYVTANERHILTHLVADAKLNNEVINILSWYIIAELSNATLKANFVDAIANSWIKAGVYDGESALLQLKQFNRQKSDNFASGRKRRKNSYRREKIEEKMPEWSKTSQQERNRKASKEEVKAIQELLAKRKQQ